MNEEIHKTCPSPTVTEIWSNSLFASSEIQQHFRDWTLEQENLELQNFQAHKNIWNLKTTNFTLQNTR